MFTRIVAFLCHGDPGDDTMLTLYGASAPLPASYVLHEISEGFTQLLFMYTYIHIHIHIYIYKCMYTYPYLHVHAHEHRFRTCLYLRATFF